MNLAHVQSLGGKTPQRISGDRSNHATPLPRREWPPPKASLQESQLLFNQRTVPASAGRENWPISVH
jgi:hypothetical protein